MKTKVIAKEIFKTKNPDFVQVRFEQEIHVSAGQNLVGALLGKNESKRRNTVQLMAVSKLEEFGWTFSSRENEKGRTGLFADGDYDLCKALGENLKIVVTESLEPSYEGQSPKIVPSGEYEGTILEKDGEPIYMNTSLGLIDDEDTFIKHDAYIEQSVADASQAS